MGHNEVTGDKLISKEGNKKAFDEGYDRIFGNKQRDDSELGTNIVHHPIQPEYIPHWVVGCEEYCCPSSKQDEE